MSKQSWKPGNMLYPLPAVLVTVADRGGKPNIFTVAWTGTVCSDPPMVSVSVRPERYSHGMIEETGEFVINLTTRKLARAADYCGVKSGRDTDKIKDMKLHLLPGEAVKAPLLAESPVNIECRVKQTLRLGSHDMYLADVVRFMRTRSIWTKRGAFIWTNHARLPIPTEATIFLAKSWAPLATASKSAETPNHPLKSFPVQRRNFHIFAGWHLRFYQGQPVFPGREKRGCFLVSPEGLQIGLSVRN